jgi:uncharacterized membrane protein
MPFHPLIVHFPIVLLFVAGVSYFFYALKSEEFYLRGANLLHIGGIFAAAIAIFTGNQAESAFSPTPEIHQMMEQHALLGWIVVWASAVLFLWQMLRLKRAENLEKWAFVAVFLVMLGLLVYGSHIGGEMVYLHGAGVIKS